MRDSISTCIRTIPNLSLRHDFSCNQKYFTRRKVRLIDAIATTITDYNERATREQREFCGISRPKDSSCFSLFSPLLFFFLHFAAHVRLRWVLVPALHYVHGTHLQYERVGCIAAVTRRFSSSTRQRP